MITKDEMLSLFRKRCSHHLISYIRTSYTYKDMRKDLRAFKRVSGYLPFSCKFKRNGKCNGASDSIMCCCKGCLGACGYIDNVFEQDISYYARNYSKVTGFWRKGKGCILSREYRSVTCLTFYCNEKAKEVDEIEAYKRVLTRTITEMIDTVDSIKERLRKEKKR